MLSVSAELVVQYQNTETYFLTKTKALEILMARRRKRQPNLFVQTLWFFIMWATSAGAAYVVAKYILNQFDMELPF